MQAPRSPVVLAAASLAIACGLAGAQAFAPSADGQELLDAAGQRAWARCVEGMRWDGRSCQGRPALFTHAEALAMARSRSAAEGRAWRVPQLRELKHFGEGLAHEPQAGTLAPAAPQGWYWTGTVRIDSESANPYAYRNVQRGATETHVDRLIVQTGWALDPRNGETRGDMPRRERLPVRLVRSVEP
ncbi:DUF1566 domain-containing protein [Roseateles saccharophilus]|uniref:Uncharacterized protein DUF1566 n=1 Tax=Roseateles saccharophilus TaxID=304 RepID=A0A4R3UIW1_ROSSA|nr:DUF1566 domain-containing protein [Roseateles saccharophilus]MDG0835892.1 DUF1566 domain-containing protein [Roseateles saccharophilus]TCU89670.1 uncharacterized protein DUF1566 [Roseateles saccharophilus]